METENHQESNQSISLEKNCILTHSHSSFQLSNTVQVDTIQSVEMWTSMLARARRENGSEEEERAKMHKEEERRAEIWLREWKAKFGKKKESVRKELEQSWVRVFEEECNREKLQKINRERLELKRKVEMLEKGRRFAEQLKRRKENLVHIGKDVDEFALIEEKNRLAMLKTQQSYEREISKRRQDFRLRTFYTFN